MTEYANIISTEEFVELTAHCTVLDCRARLVDTKWGFEAYAAGHIPGALHADLDSALADPPGKCGRHPMPSRDRFTDCVRRWGIANNSQVVVYDDAGGAFAARAWWMLRWLGHAKVALLDGGLGAWEGDLETGTGTPPAPSGFNPGPPLTKQISADGLLAELLSNTPPTLVDARTRPRWAGAEELIDPVAGHIPGALCFPFQENLDSNGRFRPAAELRARFTATGPKVVCYCGSGVSAAHNILAMHIAGLPEAALYADSWSGWITDLDRPVETAN